MFVTNILTYVQVLHWIFLCLFTYSCKNKTKHSHFVHVIIIIFCKRHSAINSSSIQCILKFFFCDMAFTNQDIFLELLENKIYPNRENSHQTYQSGVISWLWDKIFGLENYASKIHCEVLESWITSFSQKFKDELTREWAATNASKRDVLKKYKTYMDHPVEFPGNLTFIAFSISL